MPIIIFTYISIYIGPSRPLPPPPSQSNFASFLGHWGWRGGGGYEGTGDMGHVIPLRCPRKTTVRHLPLTDGNNWLPLWTSLFLIISPGLAPRYLIASRWDKVSSSTAPDATTWYPSNVDCPLLVLMCLMLVLWYFNLFCVGFLQEAIFSGSRRTRRETTSNFQIFLELFVFVYSSPVCPPTRES